MAVWAFTVFIFPSFLVLDSVRLDGSFFLLFISARLLSEFFSSHDVMSPGQYLKVTGFPDCLTVATLHPLDDFPFHVGMDMFCCSIHTSLSSAAACLLFCTRALFSPALRLFLVPSRFCRHVLQEPTRLPSSCYYVQRLILYYQSTFIFSFKLFKALYTSCISDLFTYGQHFVSFGLYCICLLVDNISFTVQRENPMFPRHDLSVPAACACVCYASKSLLLTPVECRYRLFVCPFVVKRASFFSHVMDFTYRCVCMARACRY